MKFDCGRFLCQTTDFNSQVQTIELLYNFLTLSLICLFMNGNTVALGKVTSLDLLNLSCQIVVCLRLKVTARNTGKVTPDITKIHSL